MTNLKNKHTPVLLSQVIDVLAPQAGDSYLDLTAGYGGHAAAVLGATQAAASALLVDRDQQSISRLAPLAAAGAKLIRSDFLSAAQKLVADGRQFDLILADLGVSSPHLDNSARGFAINLDGPLDMRMDQTQPLNAEKLVNSWPEANIADILRRYGEEPKAAQIARLIVAARPLTTTTELAAICRQAWPGHSRVHPATRTFQAIRIAVNDELGQLEMLLPLLRELLTPGGRVAIISFHSLEDRLVKHWLQEAAGDRYDADLRSLTKQPITADANEIVSNPRARSAKLRAAVKIKTKERSH